MAVLENDEKRTWHEWLPVFFLLVPFAMVVFGLVWSVETAVAEREACVKTGKPLHAVAGSLRVASGAYYVHAGSWRFIVHGCNGKTAKQCYEANPGIRALRDHVGSKVVVEFCEKSAVAYVVAGVRYSL